MKLHIVIASGQSFPNLIPVLMERPDVVHIVTSAQMGRSNQDTHLINLYKNYNIPAFSHPNAPEADLLKVHAYAQDLNEKIKTKHPDCEITFNATGGTKVLVLGFVDVFRKHGHRIIYTDTFNGMIEVLFDANAVQSSLQTSSPSIEIPELFDIPSHLAAQKLNYVSAKSDLSDYCDRMLGRREAAEHLAKNAHQLDNFLGFMNARASKSIETGVLSEPTHTFKVNNHAWQQAIDALAAAGCLAYNASNEQITFLDYEHTQFICGGWLEEYVFNVAKALLPSDCRLSVVITAEGKPHVKNECDVLICHHNQALFIECKTKNFMAKSSAGNDNDLSYKLSSVGGATSGLMGQIWLVSARPPTTVLKDRMRERNIKLIGPKDLTTLDKFLMNWIDKGKV